MTILIAQKTNDKIILGADTYVFGGSSKEEYKKIFTTNNLTLACAGMVTVIQLLDLYCSQHQPNDATNFEVTKFTSNFKSFCKNEFDVSINEAEVAWFMIYDNNLYECRDGVACKITEGFSTLGSAWMVGRVAMLAGLDVKQAIELTIKTSVDAGGEADIYEHIIK